MKKLLIVLILCSTMYKTMIGSATATPTTTNIAANITNASLRIAIVGTEWSPIAKNINCAANTPIMCATAFACCEDARRDISSSVEAFDEQANILINKIQGVAIDLEKEKSEAQRIREQQSQRINDLKEQLSDCISK